MAAKYLLDSNICIYILRGKKGLRKLISEKGWNNCCISEITLAELLYGAECSNDGLQNKAAVLDFSKDIQIVRISEAIEEYARQKAALRRKGTMIDDFDLLIGCSAVVRGCVLVTENISHLQRIENIQIENWIQHQ